MRNESATRVRLWRTKLSSLSCSAWCVLLCAIVAGCSTESAPGTSTAKDDDTAGVTTTISAVERKSTATEGDTVEFVVTATPAPPAELAVSVALQESETMLPASHPETLTVTIAAGETTGKLMVATVDDQAAEPESTVTATLKAGSGYTVGSPSSAQVVVSDNDGSPTDDLRGVAIRAVTSSATEGASVQFAVRATPEPELDSPLTVTVEVEETGSMLTATGRSSVTITGSGSATLTVATEDDSDDEPDSRVTAEVTAVTGKGGYTVGSPSSATVTVSDNDGGDDGDDGTETSDPPDDTDSSNLATVRLTGVTPAMVAEGQTVMISLSADPAPAEPISVTVLAYDSEFTGFDLSTVGFGVGDTTGSYQYTVRSTANVTSSRSVRFDLPSGNGYNTGGSDRTVTVTDQHN